MSDMISSLHLSCPVVESTLTVSITPLEEKARSYPWQSFVHILNRNYFFAVSRINMSIYLLCHLKCFMER